MPSALTESGALYSPVVGMVYVFNLIVGTGALTMPRAFGEAGWLVGLIMIIVLAFTSYVTATFVIETMAAANAATRLCKNHLEDNPGSSQNIQDNAVSSETTPLLVSDNGDDDFGSADLFEIKERIEMGHMASLFFNKVGMNIFYTCLALYLYGDLAIYMAAVPKSLRDVICTYSQNTSVTCNASIPDSDPCWDSINSPNRQNAYRICVVMFILTLGPFVFFNIQRTKYLQIFTTLLRWLAFIIMITLASIRIASGKGEGHPQIANPPRIPTLFGVCVYSFMCHHSLPSLATPIRNKKNIFSLFGLDYVFILLFYSVLSFTGIFTFNHIEDLYTLNFQPDRCTSASLPITSVAFIQYFLALFPVFTLSTNFPIIGITLRNNLKTLFSPWAPFHWAVDRLAFPVAAILIPFGIALVTDNLETLVGITGSYAGAAIQYFIPAALVMCSRKYIDTINIELKSNRLINKYKSPFGHNIWAIGIFVWGTVCIAVVTVNFGIYGLEN